MGQNYPNRISLPLIVKAWYTKDREGYSSKTLLAVHGILWLVQFQSYPLFHDPSAKEQMGLSDTHPVARALNTAYSGDLVLSWRYYVDIAEIDYQKDICYTILNRTDV